MTIQIFDHSQTSEQTMTALLSLFRNSTKEDDYMAIGEVSDMETLRRVLDNKNLIHYFGYESDKPIAYCQVVYKAESANFNSGAKINAISVLPDMRGHGLGKELLEGVIASLRKNTRIKNIYLEVVKDNTAAIELYQRVGFEKVGELKNLFTKNDSLHDIEIYSFLVN